jgi:hypothetical protein
MPHLKDVLDNFKHAGKRLIFVSNSPFWYVDAGMKYVIGENWRQSWDAVITSAGKPIFYTEQRRPFRQVNTDTGRVKFNLVDRFEQGTFAPCRQCMIIITWAQKYRCPPGFQPEFKKKNRRSVLRRLS